MSGESTRREFTSSLSRHIHNSIFRLWDLCKDSGPVSRRSSELCGTCKKLQPVQRLAGLVAWQRGPAKKLGWARTLRMKVNCPLCRLIVQAIRMRYVALGTTRQPLCWIECYFLAGSCVVMDVYKGEGTIQLARTDAIKVRQSAQDVSTQTYKIEEEAFLRPVRRHRFDADLVRSWVEDCIRDHGYNCCADRPHTPRDDLTIKLLLIDVKERRLVEQMVAGEPEVQYVALSYVWGQVGVLQNVGSNLAELKEPGALSSATVPRVVNDAMALVEAIGDCYLWVDALCIIQDAPDKNEQLQIMDMIYMRARLTIIAMSGEDANCGLPGVMPGTRKEQPTETIDGYTCMAELPSLQIEKDQSPHFTRAWTYQEMMLSPRCLFISSYQFHFRCNSRLFSEDCDGEIYQSPMERTVCCISSSGDEKDFMYGYRRYVRAYTHRSLTYDHDIINAFSGILQELSSRFQMAFHAAIPDKAICTALFWCPMKPPQRRTLTNGLRIPSWSWASWKGPITYQIRGISAENGCGSLLSGAIKIKNPGEAAFKTIHSGGQDRGKCNGYQCLVSLGTDVTDSRRAQDLSENIRMNSLTILQFCASTVNVDSVRLGKIRNGAPYRAGSWEFRELKFLPIYDMQNRFCGGFINPSIPIIAGGRGRCLKIIAISSFSERIGSSSETDSAEGHMNCFSIAMDRTLKKGAWEPGDEYKVACPCIMNVMLIEWHGDVAERVAVGQIHPRAWAQADPKFEIINLA